MQFAIFMRNKDANFRVLKFKRALGSAKVQLLWNSNFRGLVTGSGRLAEGKKAKGESSLHSSPFRSEARDITAYTDEFVREFENSRGVKLGFNTD